MYQAGTITNNEEGGGANVFDEYRNGPPVTLGGKARRGLTCEVKCSYLGMYVCIPSGYEAGAVQMGHLP